MLISQVLQLFHNSFPPYRDINEQEEGGVKQGLRVDQSDWQGRVFEGHIGEEEGYREAVRDEGYEEEQDYEGEEVKAYTQ